ncbi:MAG: zinc ribbon domain-containing protein [Bacteroidaceae bacterium]
MRNLFVLLLILLLSSCYNRTQEAGLYEVNDNFVVTADSLRLQSQQPLHNMPTVFSAFSDSLFIRRGEELVIAQVVVIPEDSVDSVWVKVARDQMLMGWTHEQDLLSSVVPNDPISRFIYVFSLRHLPYFVSLIVMALALLLVRHVRHAHSRVFLLNDIASVYPTLFMVVLGGAAVLYAHIQRFEPDMWVRFYYHPTLNPFSLPLMLGLFVLLFWLLLILFLAAVDEVFSQLSLGEALFYMFTLLGMSMCLYTLFSMAAFYWAGVILYVVFAVVALTRFFLYFRPRYLCGRCGCKMHDLGPCSHCGAHNA